MCPVWNMTMNTQNIKRTTDQKYNGCILLPPKILVPTLARCAAACRTTGGDLGEISVVSASGEEDPEAFAAVMARNFCKAAVVAFNPPSVDVSAWVFEGLVMFPRTRLNAAIPAPSGLIESVGSKRPSWKDTGLNGDVSVLSEWFWLVASNKALFVAASSADFSCSSFRTFSSCAFASISSLACSTLCCSWDIIACFIFSWVSFSSSYPDKTNQNNYQVGHKVHKCCTSCHDHTSHTTLITPCNYGKPQEICIFSTWFIIFPLLRPWCFSKQILHITGYHWII